MKTNIRKISAGPSPKNDSMAFEVGQSVYGGHIVSHIDINDMGYHIYIGKGSDVKPWKSYNHAMPIALEYDLDYESNK